MKVKYSVITSLIIGLIVTLFYTVYYTGIKLSLSYFLEYIVFSVAVSVFVIYPIVLTFINIYNLIFNKISKIYSELTLAIGILYSFLVLFFLEISFNSDWNVVLYNSQVHSPIYTKAYPTVICMFIIGLIGYLILNYFPLSKMPPLVIVICISFIYIGIFENVLWIIQLFGKNYVLCLLPFNYIILCIQLLRYKMTEWKKIDNESKKVFYNKILERINQVLMNSFYWPLYAFLFMIPILVILMCILILFNQQPNYLIKSYLETSDWNLSQKVSPQNIYYDEHYLCTVAAGGHEKIVKPLRLGERHHHKVIVNRQLCIANAFEQILEEKTPKFHKRVRYIYDNYGFEIAKKIHSPFIADMIYCIMKPLEWIFLLVLYIVDINPEDRISIQYLPKGEVKHVI